MGRRRHQPAIGKDICDVVLDFNRSGASPDERLDGIHYDVEHDNWNADRWTRYLDLIIYCQNGVNVYNQTHAPIVFGVDIPPRFLTGPDSSGAVMSFWDVLNVVDYATLMNFRDFADVRHDGNTDGIIARGQTFSDLQVLVSGPPGAQQYKPALTLSGLTYYLDIVWEDTRNGNRDIFFSEVATPLPAFDDIPSDYWAYDWVIALAASGITSGCSTSPPLYCPEDPVTRAQMAVFLVRTFDLPMP